MGLFRLRSCCFCYDVEPGARIIAFVQIVVGIVAAIVSLATGQFGGDAYSLAGGFRMAVLTYSCLEP